MLGLLGTIKICLQQLEIYGNMMMNGAEYKRDTPLFCCAERQISPAYDRGAVPEGD